MEEQQSTVNILVIWREKKMNVEMNSSATLKEFGHKLQKLTNVKADTMRLLVPQSSDKSSQLLTPFSDKHSSLSLQESSIFEGKSIRMMGVFQDEIDQVSRNAKADLRIAGFDEEERRSRQRMLNGPQPSLKLPQGAYIFCDFRTLNIPGMELNPPASEALRRMHMLAADPGIVAIMNKHRWQVGIMTEMAPVGYVGISPKCILGFNKNHGEEISLRLRTDDLKGFRKYASIKKTLLHELAHMVHSEHDANFYALDKQLNQEADSLDWTRSKGHTLSGVRRSEPYEEFFVGTSGSSSQKLGGRRSDHLANARSSSVAAAYRRLENASTNNVERIEVHVAPDPDDSGFEIHEEPDPDDSVVKEDMQLENLKIAHSNPNCEPDPDDYSGDHIKFEPDPDDSQSGDAMDYEPCSGINGNRIKSESYPGDCEMAQCVRYLTTDEKLMDPKTFEESDPYKYATVAEPDPDDSLTKKTVAEPDPDDSEVKGIILEYGNSDEPDPDDSRAIETVEDETPLRKTSEESDPDDSEVKGTILDCGNTAEPGPDDSRANTIMYTEPACNDDVKSNREGSRMQADEPDPDDQELQRIQDPVRIVSLRLQKAIEMLQSEVNRIEALSVLQTLFKIIRNVIEHPDEIKFRRLRKANPLFQRNVANYKAAIEFLFLVGFIEEVVSNETYVVLKRNDPGLLWLAKSSLEMCIAC